MRVLIATVQTPFVRGGAEILADSLLGACLDAGYEAEIAAVPFKPYPPEVVTDQMLAWRLLDLSQANGRPIDRLVCLRFPAYLAQHPRKSVWLVHQHRPAYELWGTPMSDLSAAPNGAVVRDAIHAADNAALAECVAVRTISNNVSRRLFLYNGVSAPPLYPPPVNASRFRCAEAGDFFYCPSRLTQIKRQEHVLAAVAKTRTPVHVVFAGGADDPRYRDRLAQIAAELNVVGRVTFAGQVSDDEHCRLFAECLGVVYVPFDEDYGYVTLEAMLSAKPVITCADSGGPLEFVRHGVTGLVAPSAEGIADALDALWSDRQKARALGAAGRDVYETFDLGWAPVLEGLLA